MTGTEKVRAATYAMIRHRLARLQRLLLDPATPDFLVSTELSLLGELSPQLDPDAWALRMATKHAQAARRRAGLCTILTCDEPAQETDELCSGHARSLDNEADEALQEALAMRREDLS